MTRQEFIVAIAAVMVGVFAAMTIERTNPATNYSVARKGDRIVPVPVKTLNCTKRFCEPHPKNLENLPPEHRRGIP
jgi:hypothetical protein